MSLAASTRWARPFGCLAVIMVSFTPASAADPGGKSAELALLKQPVTSLGAAIAEGYLYVYGGHLGSPHEYASDLQAHQLLRLNLAKPTEWEFVAEGPRRTGLAMVSFGGKLYRVGGWEAKNAKGTEQNLVSSRDFSRFDAKSGKWQDLAPLPEGRSSHDAALVGSQLYVVGGWELAGSGSGQWHETAYVCDLAQENPQWKPIAKPPFNRRALAVAGYAGKLYVIGGMDDSNDMSSATNLYDPQSNSWSVGPNLPGQPGDAFGTAAIGTAAGLFATTREGLLYRLSADGKEWKEVAKLNHGRSFHRLVADGENRLLVVGGTARGGKVAEIESVPLRSEK